MAFLSYTYGLNGFRLPQGEEYAVNLFNLDYYTTLSDPDYDRLQADLEVYKERLGRSIYMPLKDFGIKPCLSKLFLDQEDVMRTEIKLMLILVILGAAGVLRRTCGGVCLRSRGPGRLGGRQPGAGLDAVPAVAPDCSRGGGNAHCRRMR